MESEQSKPSTSSKKKRSRRWFSIAVFCLAGWSVVAWAGARLLIVRSDVSSADAIVVLSGSSTYIERTHHAAQLFRENRAPKIILTNDTQLSGWSADTETNPTFLQRAIRELGRQNIPPDKVEVVPEPVYNTFDEIMMVRKYAAEHNLHSILVVTSGYHSRRALWTLRQVFRDTKVEIGMDPVGPGQQTPPPYRWWLKRFGWKMVAGEYLKLIYYRCRYG